MLIIQTGQDNPILRKPSEKVGKITKKTLQLIKEMEESMKVEKGVGLAAPQVGDNERILLAQIGKRVVPMINPEILNHSDRVASGEEGCLSLPGEWGQVERFTEITVRFLDTHGKENILRLKDFDARVVQHEVDHLDGILFTDHVKPVVANFLTIPKERETERL